MQEMMPTVYEVDSEGDEVEDADDGAGERITRAPAPAPVDDARPLTPRRALRRRRV